MSPNNEHTAWRFGPFLAAFLLASLLGLVAAPTVKSVRSDVFETATLFLIVLLWSVFLLARRWRSKSKAMYWTWITVTLLSPYIAQYLAYEVAPRVFAY